MDENNCSSLVVNVTINEPQPLTALLSSTPQVISLDGTATVNVTGGTTPYSYEWNDLNNQTEALAVYLNSGWYSVAVTDANGCQLLDSVFVDMEAGTQDLMNNDFVIYPNPAKNTLSILGEGIAIRMFDLNGKIIIDRPFVNTLDVSSFPNGLYTIEVVLENYTTRRKRFTKLD
jgi:hypothetical protein